jgi:NADPH:quinone reductase-like Zn-dependent oxidoreductase
MFEAMNRMLAANEIHPVIDRVFAFEEARAAYDHMKSGAHVGKIVIRIAA